MRIFYCIVFLLTLQLCNAQDSVLNKYGLWVISNVTNLQKTIRKSPHKQLISLTLLLPDVKLDLRYSTANNFTGQQLYPILNTTYLRKPAADSLAAVQKELNKNGLGLKIFDAYRPYSVTEKMWQLVPDERYAADPKKGSGHNRGAAVDLTLIKMGNNEELDMGTGFDNFTDTAHHTFINLPETVLQNRLLLKNTMEAHGFKALDTEWWHYYLPDAKQFELLNISFDALDKMFRRKIKK